jgi:hypothetical protein
VFFGSKTVIARSEVTLTVAYRQPKAETRAAIIAYLKELN